MKICVVIPAFNEEIHIKTVVEKIKLNPDISAVYVVDDGSSDQTSKTAEEAGATVLSHKVNMGVGSALRDGFVRAKKDGMEVIVVMGGDDQDDPAQISRLIEPIIKDGFDLVQGSRWIEGGKVENIPLFRRITTQLYAIYLRIFTGFYFTDGTNGFRAFRTSILDNINLDQTWLNTYELEPYLLFKAIALKMKVTEAPVTKIYHIKEGYTKMIPLLDWWRIAKPVLYLKLRIKK